MKRKELRDAERKHFQLIMGIFLRRGAISYTSVAKWPVFYPPRLSLSDSLSCFLHPYSRCLRPSITPLQTGLSLWGALSFPLG